MLVSSSQKGPSPSEQFNLSHGWVIVSECSFLVKGHDDINNDDMKSERRNLGSKASNRAVIKAFKALHGQLAIGLQWAYHVVKHSMRVHCLCGEASYPSNRHP